MRSYFTLFLPFILFFSCTQENNENTEFKNEMEQEVIENCINKNEKNLNFSFEERLNSVEIVSYNFPRQGVEITEAPKYNTKILEEGKIGFNQFREKILLTPSQIDSLKDIILNYGSDMIIGADCYQPRHCIYFKDKEDVIIAYLEVCYQCHNSSTKLSELRLVCDEQFGKLEDFMSQCGIKHGLYGDRSMTIPDSIYNNGQ